MTENMLDTVIRQSVMKGGTVLNRTETTATIVEPKRFDPLGCLLLGGFLYILWYGLVQRDTNWYVEVQPDGSILWNGCTLAEVKRRRLVRNVTFGVAVFLVLTLCCWAWFTTSSTS